MNEDAVYDVLGSIGDFTRELTIVYPEGRDGPAYPVWRDWVCAPSTEAKELHEPVERGIVRDR